MIAAIVLAGGASQRMGAPKALLPFRGTTFLEAILDAALATGLAPRVVVVGYDSDKILSHIVLADVVVAVSEAPHLGPIGSIRAGVRAVLNQPVEGVLVCHVDQPHVRIETMQTLVDTFRRERPAIIVPTYQGRRGHPVLFGRPVFAELWGPSPDRDGARAIVHQDPARVREVSVDDRAVLDDIDTPEAYQKLLRALDSVRE